MKSPNLRSIALEVIQRADPGRDFEALQISSDIVLLLDDIAALRRRLARSGHYPQHGGLAGAYPKPPTVAPRGIRRTTAPKKRRGGLAS